MSYKHQRGGAGQRKKSSEKIFLKKQSSSVDENTLDQGKKVEIIELKEKIPRPTTRENSAEKVTSAAGSFAGIGEETSFNLPKLDKKSGSHYLTKLFFSMYLYSVFFLFFNDLLIATIFASNIRLLISQVADHYFLFLVEFLTCFLILL